jgi:hypothetical protein
VKTRKISGEGSGKQSTTLGAGPIVAFPAPRIRVWRAIVTFTFVVQRRLHPVAERDWTVPSNALLQSFRQRRRMCNSLDHALRKRDVVFETIVSDSRQEARVVSQN